jgi:hypothetical protein
VDYVLEFAELFLDQSQIVVLVVDNTEMDAALLYLNIVRVVKICVIVLG